MSGSRKTFEYTDTLGNKWAVDMDESNGEAVGNTDFTDSSTASFFAPRNIELRYGNYRSADGKYQKPIVLTEQDASPSTVPASITVSTEADGDVVLLLTGIVGERVKVIPKAADTAIDDGDDT